MQCKNSATLVLSCIITTFVLSSAATADMMTFQQGANGYARAQDSAIRWAYSSNFGDTPEEDSTHVGDAGAYEMWSTNGGAATILEAGNFFQRVLGGTGDGSTVEAGPTYRYSRFFLRFRDVFGTGANQIPSDAPIRSATLELYHTEDLGAVAAAGAAALPDPAPGPGVSKLPNPQAQPKLNAGSIGIYPLLTSIKYGNNDGTANKGVVTAQAKRRGKEGWSQVVPHSPTPPHNSGTGVGCESQPRTPNDPFENAFNCGPADVGDPDSKPGTEEYDSSHPAAVDIFQNADSGIKSFDVTGLIDFITGNGVFVTAISPDGELPTLDINYGQAYRSSEFGSSAADIATRPKLLIDFIPEPTTLGLIGIGGLALLRRSRIH